MARLGYDPVQLLAHAQRSQSEYDFAVPADQEPSAAPAKAAAIGLQPSPEEKGLEDMESRAYFPSAAAAGSPSDDEVAAILREQVQEVRIMDAPPAYIDGLEILLTEMVRAFALELSKLPPVDMPPMEIKLKPGAKPFRCRARRYSREHREFLARHVKELLDAGLCYRNPSSRWCSPPLVINKPGAGNFRMTVDVRGPNEQVEPTAWPMPILEVEFDRLRGAKYYFSLDFLQSFWQFGTAPSCQEIYSILTEEGVITPTRVLMGGTNSVAHVQSTVQAMFADVHNKGLLIWIDDLLGYSATAEGLLALLRKVLTICVKRGLKLNPRKCKFFLREAKWCGRVVSGDGVKHDPERIAALQALPSPVTGQQLQQFVCALNWMRMSIPAYNKLVEPLTTFLEKVYTAGGGRKKANVRGVQLATIGWGAGEEACLEACRGALQNALQLAHPDPEKRLCVFTDASDLHWGAAITQVPHEHLSREFSEQHHEPLMMISGTFSGAAKRWAIVEKEAYAIVETCKRADYLVQRADGFLLFTDHRNLRFIFAPTTVMASVPKYTADKLHRWSLILMGFRYEIHDIAGDSNVWADLLSRWGSSFTTVCAIRHTVFPVSPQLDSTFEWPTIEVIRASQRGKRAPPGFRKDDTKVSRDSSGRLWLPDSASDLQLRVCIIGHFGAAGHRSVDVTLASIREHFVWSTLEKDVRLFVARCLHCASVSGGPPNPRPLGEAIHGEKPNEVLHWDYLHLGKSSTGEEYVLVLKDDASHFVWLIPCAVATADTTYVSLIDWFASFGVCHTWVSDQGTHFKNRVIEALEHLLGAHHHFTTARCPWANGTVEVVMREVLRCARSLLSEWRMATTEWPKTIKLVQMVLNNSPSYSLGGVAPITAMTGIKAMSPFDPLAVPQSASPATLQEIQQNRRLQIEKLQAALDQMHKRMVESNQKVRARGRQTRGQKQGTRMAQFEIGDYVLYADVWAHSRSKLRVRWCGPAQVTAATSNWIFKIKNIVTGDEREAHASRLKFYSDSSLELSEDLLQHVAHNSEGHVVLKFLRASYDAAAKCYKLLVRWRGLSEQEDSWEPVQVMLEDVPAVVKTFISEHADEEIVRQLADAHGLAIE